MRIEGLVFAAALTCAPLAAFADGASEAVTAQTHADLAAHGADLMTVHMHLHHAVNCLVGPSGAGFDSKNLNPCANAGNGAIPDTTDPGRKKLLTEASAKAQAGIASMHFAA